MSTVRNPKQLALEKTDKKREETSALLPEALDLCKDIYGTVEYFFRKDTNARPPPEMRTLGRGPSGEPAPP